MSGWHIGAVWLPDGDAVEDGPLPCMSCTCHSTTESSNTGPQYDGIIDLALHLCMLAFAQSPAQSSWAAFANPRGPFNASLLKDLCEMEQDGDFKVYRPRVSAILDVIAEHFGDNVKAVRLSKSSTAQPAMSAEDARKAAVKKRQEAILAVFAKNQQQFFA